MKSAVFKVGAKLGLGLGLIAAVIGIRIVTATPKGVEAEIAELDAVAAETGVVANTPSVGEPRPNEQAPPSLVSRLGAGMRERIPGSERSARDDDKLVSCRLGSGTQFMRAADCATRGGRSTVLEDDR